MKLLIIGADGQLGSDYVRLAEEIGCEMVGIDHAGLDIGDRDRVFATLRGLEFDVIVNTAAYHGPDAYRDASPDKHFAVNVHGPHHLAQYAEQNGKTLVHFSTDYVFSGNPAPAGGGFTEDDAPRPANLYGASKLAGEAMLPTATSRFFVFRVASLYGIRGCKAKNRSNFVELVIEKLKKAEPMEVVDDIVMSPTSTRSVVLKTSQVARSEAFGLYHLAGSGHCTWYELAKEVARSMELPSRLIEKSSSDSVTQQVQRGKNTALTNGRLVANGFGDIPHWKNGLREYLRERSGGLAS